MIDTVAQVTIATSSGAVWLALIVHFGAGVVALGSGFLAIAVAKGGRTHRRAGMAFVIAMIALGVFAAGIATYERKASSVIGGLFTAYLVFTAFTTVRPLGGRQANTVNIGATLVGSALALIQIQPVVIALGDPGRVVHGIPNGMIVFIGTITLLAAVGDWRLLHAGSITGSRRLARHLWRMCFALFVASGSFFFGQVKFLPESLRIMPLLSVLGISPLVVLLYWMWRVRVRGKLQGVILHPAAEAAAK